jgi:hypothetical protein
MIDGNGNGDATDGGNAGTSILLVNLNPTLFFLAVLLSIYMCFLRWNAFER